MRYVKNLILLFYILLPALLQAQEVSGVVFTIEKDKKTPLFGAAVRWEGTTIGTTTDLNGKFTLIKPDSLHMLVTSFVGYQNDTQHVSSPKSNLEIILVNPDFKIAEVEVVEKVGGSFMSTISPETKEIISNRELLKAACCNLSESFETNASVDVNFSDAVTGAKQIRMLGLQGIYSQIMMENMPYIRGLASPYGLSYVPGTSISSIQLSKGAGSVVNGYESMAGQINLELIKPHNPEKLYLNLYGDANGRAEANLNLTHQLNEKWGSALLLHGDGLFRRFDMNNDGFMDMPLAKQVNVLNRWSYFDGKKLESQFGVSGLVQNKVGGQITYDPATDKLTKNAYGIGIDTRRLEAFAKAGIVFPAKPWKSFGSQFSGTIHEHDAYFGLNTYNGTQKTFYSNLIYQSMLFSTNHKIKSGASFLLDDFDESFNDSAFARQELVPGVFTEYSYLSLNEDLSLVGGLRADFHNMFGLMITPRVHARYGPGKHFIFRASAGKGYRTPNVFVENAAVWASSRKIIFLEAPQQEVSWNYGGSVLYNFEINKKKGHISADYFKTEFENQLLADIDYHPQQVLIYNLKGTSYSNSFQVEGAYSPIERLDLKVAYKWQDVKTTYHGELLQKPLVPRTRILGTASYSTRFDKWMFNLTGMRYGETRLPKTDASPQSFQRGQYSPAYYIVNVQIEKNFKKWSLYGGSENLLGYRQPNPIVAANDPFGPYFDASMVWGPIEGRRIYAGLRYKIE